MTLNSIKEAIELLPPEERTILVRWLSERHWKPGTNRSSAISLRVGVECRYWLKWNGRSPKARLARWKKFSRNGVLPAGDISISDARTFLAMIR